MTKHKLKKYIISLIIAAVITAAFGFGIFDSLDLSVSDALYQHEESTDGEIVIVGIDDYALGQFGQMPWDRTIFADFINCLNKNDETKPAVIALDVLFSGESDDDADAALIEACKNAGNVVVACSGVFGTDIIESEEGFYIDSRALLEWNEPFEELKDYVSMGCINAMADNDGNIRHVMYYVDVPEKGQVKSMPEVIYRKYCEYCGIEANVPNLTDDFWYLPYTGKSGEYYESISVADVISGDVEPEFFEGKIVLVGPYASGLGDEYRTSIDHADVMYGIEIQANQIDALRKGFFPTEVSDFLQLAILFVVCFLLFNFVLDRRLAFSIAIWIGAMIVSLAACFGLYRLELIFHALWIPVASTVIFLTAIAFNYIKALNEKRQVTETFGRYVDPAVLNQLLEADKGALDLGGKSYDIAVLFVDIRGFTTMSESLPPETVVEILNKYLSLTTDCIMRYHGTLDKFVGDCTMAFWNAPLPQEDPVYLACCAAMDMVKAAKDLGEELMTKFGRSVDFGIGVHYGPAVVGNIGAARRMDYTAIGDTVNTSSRLESNAPKGTIYISRVVADALGDRAETTSLGSSIKLKGKAEGFEVLKLDSLKY